MKRIILFLLFSVSLFLVIGQTTVPFPMPTAEITNSSYNGSTNNYYNHGGIYTSGSFNALKGSYTKLISSTSISLRNPVYIRPSSTGTYANNYFTAKIKEDDLQLAWFSPNSPGWVKKNDKLEIGIILPNAIQEQVQNFVDHQSTPNTLPKLNPYNPEDVDIKAEFFYYSSTVGWVPLKTKYGFFYENFERNTSDPNPNNWDWTRLPTLYNFRIRMTPENRGKWKCLITTNIKGFGTLTQSEFEFECYNSNLDGFVKVDQSTKRHFTINNKLLYPIGRCLPHPELFEYTDRQGNFQDPYNCNLIPKNFWGSWNDDLYRQKGFSKPVYSYYVYGEQLKLLKSKGANMFRISNTPYDYHIEFEKLGNYYSRMYLAYEMDLLLNTLENEELKMYWIMTHAGELRDTDLWDWNTQLFNWFPSGDPLDVGYCYGTELGLNPTDFFTDSRAKKHFKNKLRYMLSRWGYSTSIAVIDLINEINQVDGGSVVFSVSRSDREAWQIEMHNYIKNILGHKNHLIGVHHTGISEIFPNVSYPTVPLSQACTDNNVDVVSISSYDGIFERKPDNKNAKSISNAYDKPFLFLEIGAGGKEGIDLSDCENYVEQTKDFWSSTFTQAAGSGFNWHRSHRSMEVWHQFDNMKTFLNGVDLRKFTFSDYVVNKSEIGELQYLQNNTDNQAIGVIINKSWNSITHGQGICNNKKNYNGAIGNSLSTYKVIKGADFFKIKVGAPYSKYLIKYYRGIDNNLYLSKSVVKWSNLNGKIKIKDFNDIQSIIGFKVHRYNQPSFFIPKSDSSFIIHDENAKEYVETPIFDNDSNKIERALKLSENINESNKIIVYPNPTQNVVTVKISKGLNILIESFVLIGINGEIIFSNKWDNKNELSIDLTNYPSGTYLLGMYAKDGQYYFKRIIKQ